MEKFKIAYSEGSLKEVEGERLSINGIECFVFNDEWGINISHVTTGMVMARNLFDKDEAISEAKRNMKRHPNWLKGGIKTLKEYGFSYPVNN